MEPALVAQLRGDTLGSRDQRQALALLHAQRPGARADDHDAVHAVGHGDVRERSQEVNDGVGAAPDDDGRARRYVDVA